MKIFSAFVLLLFLFGSCKKDKPYVPFVIPCQLTQDIPLSQTYIKGTWEWVEEHRIERGQNGERYLTPKTEGYTRRMIFRDSIMQFLKNNNVEGEFKYKVSFTGDYTGTNYPEDSLPALIFYKLPDGGEYSHIPIKICDKYLVLQNQYVSSIIGEEIWKKL